MSDTDSEVITALITNFLDNGKSHLEAVKETIKTLKGSYALAIIFTDLENTIIGAKNGSPLVAGLNGVSHFLGSDSLALTSLATKVCYLEDGDLAVLRSDSIEIFDSNGSLANRPFENNNLGESSINLSILLAIISSFIKPFSVWIKLDFSIISIGKFLSSNNSLTK